MRREFLIAISNPKAILIFTAFFPQFLDRSQEPGSQLLVMGATFLVLEAVALGLYALAGAGAGRFLSSPRGQKLLNRLSGGALMAAGTAMALSRR
jgi:threonine/homoserine/homoserine lactone efflux protein